MDPIVPPARQNQIIVGVAENDVTSAQTHVLSGHKVEGGKVRIGGCGIDHRVVVDQQAVVAQNHVFAVITADFIGTAVIDTADHHIVVGVTDHGIRPAGRFTDIGGLDLSDQVVEQIKPAVVAQHEVGQIIRSVGTGIVIAVHEVSAHAADQDIPAGAAGHFISAAPAVHKTVNDIESTQIRIDSIVVDQLSIVTQQNVIAVIAAQHIGTAIDTTQDDVIPGVT